MRLYAVLIYNIVGTPTTVELENEGICMTLPEFLRRIKTADTDEIIELFKKYPDLAQQCADQIKEEL